MPSSEENTINNISDNLQSEEDLVNNIKLIMMKHDLNVAITNYKNNEEIKRYAIDLAREHFCISNSVKNPISGIWEYKELTSSKQNEWVENNWERFVDKAKQKIALDSYEKYLDLISNLNFITNEFERNISDLKKKEFNTLVDSSNTNQLSDKEKVWLLINLHDRIVRNENEKVIILKKLEDIQSRLSTIEGIMPFISNDFKKLNNIEKRLTSVESSYSAIS